MRHSEWLVFCLICFLKWCVPGVAVALGSSLAGRTRGLTPSSSTGAAPRDLSRYQLDLKVYSRKELSCVSTLRRLDVMHFALLITELFSVFRS